MDEAEFLERLNGLTSRIIGAAIAVHSELGPGLFESAYQKCMRAELPRAGLAFQAEMPVAVVYKGELVDEEGYRIDLMVEDTVVVELKSVETIKPLHKKQLLTYVRLAKKPVGLLINFNVQLLKDGIHRIIDTDWLKSHGNGLPDIDQGGQPDA